MKKFLILLIGAAMVLGLCACGKEKNNNLQDLSQSESAEVTQKSDSAENGAAAENEETTENDAKTKFDESWVSLNEEETNDEEKTEQTPEQDIEPEKKAPLSPEEIYTQVLDGYYADLVGEFPIDNYFPMTLGTFEITIYCESDAVLKSVGYSIEDINGDETPELLIVKVSNQGQTAYHGEQILSMFTIKDEEAHFLAGGWDRNRYYLLTDGRIWNEGSSGADDSSFELYNFIEGSDVLEQIESKDSQSGDFAKQYEELEKLIETVELKTFAQYEPSEKYPESAKTFWSSVYVNPAEKTFATVGANSFKTENSDYAMDLVFFTPSEVSDFKFNALTPMNSDDGELTFAEEELYSLDSLIMDKAVTITMGFAGDTPNYGISYTDAAGNVRKYAICQSGFDGSIYLLKY